MPEVPPPRQPRHTPTGPVRWQVVPVSAVLDVSTASRLREQFIDAVAAGHTHVIADLSAVSFMDSTGLGVLVGGLKRVLARDGALRLAGAGRDVLRLLRITGLDRVLPVYPSIEQAQQTAPAR